jgi:hypothetical protein
MSDPITVTVNPTPSAAITAPGSVCSLGTGYTASVPAAGPGSTYAWTAVNAAIQSGQGSNTITFDASSTGPVTINVTVTSASGCSKSGSVVIPMNPSVSGSISANPTTISGGDTSTLTLTVANATSWSLSSALGNSFSQANGTNNGTFNVIYGADNNAGLDTVTLTINGDCGGPITRTVNIQVN